MRIEKNVPLPKGLSDRIDLGPIPLKELRVGDSISITANTKKELDKKIRALRMRCLRFSKKHPHYKFRIAFEKGTNNTQQIRVWRVSRGG